MSWPTPRTWLSCSSGELAPTQWSDRKAEHEERDSKDDDDMWTWRLRLCRRRHRDSPFANMYVSSSRSCVASPLQGTVDLLPHPSRQEWKEMPNERRRQGRRARAKACPHQGLLGQTLRAAATHGQSRPP